MYFIAGYPQSAGFGSFAEKLYFRLRRDLVLEVELEVEDESVLESSDFGICAGIKRSFNMNPLSLESESSTQVDERYIKIIPRKAWICSIHIFRKNQMKITMT